MKMHLRQAKVNDALAISELVQAGFIAHIAPDWESSAQRTFLEETGADQLASRISEAAVCLICEEGDQVLGVISLPRPTLVQLFFVAPGHLRKGIGRTLWSAVRTHLEVQHPDVKTVELNSSPYALAAYKALGFFPISKPFRRKGAVATRMACWLPGNALEQAPSPARKQMARQIVFTPKAAKPPATYSQAVKAAGLVFVSGTAPTDPATGAIKGTTIQDQTRQCLINIQAILEEAGSSLDKIVSVTIVLADEEDFAGMNEEWLKWFPSDPPARQGAKLPARIPGLKVSIAAIAEA